MPCLFICRKWPALNSRASINNTLILILEDVVLLIFPISVSPTLCQRVQIYWQRVMRKVPYFTCAYSKALDQSVHLKNNYFANYRRILEIC